MANLYALIQSSLHARDAAVVIDSDERHIGARQLDAHVGRYANALRTLGLKPGDRIAVQVDKSFENVVLYLAALRIGAVYLPLNTAYRPAEIQYFLGDASPGVFVADPARESELRNVANAAGVGSTMTLGTHGDGTLVELAAAQESDAFTEPRGDDDLAVICYTSGTTGRSKGAMITHGNLISNARSLIAAWEFTDSDVLLHALPLYHIHGLFVALHCALLSGARILLEPRFDARSALQSLKHATVMMGVPTFYTRLLAERSLDREAVKQVRLFISGSAPLLAETFAAFEQTTGQRILERYGMTETGMIASNPLHGERRAGTVGLPLPDVSVRITDESGAELPATTVGMVEVRGPNVFKGYWNMPEKTAADMRSDGYFITGDLGLREADGYLRLIGRAKDLIISGGLNVYPKEIEDAIDALDGVVESAVFAIPHPDFGEAVAAAVTLQASMILSPADIIAALRTQLAAFKTPKRVYVLEELPRNAMGKVQKAKLRETYKDEFS